MFSRKILFNPILRNFSRQVSHKTFVESNSWGILTSIDIHNCCPFRIRDPDQIKKYVDELCKLIDMKKYGNCQVVNFGQEEKVAGYSLVQLIETSCITGHFSNQTNRSYIDIFSCKYYDPKIASEFTANFFCSNNFKYNVLLRK